MSTVTFAGLGSGMDVERLITGLVQVSRDALSPLKSRISSTKAAVSSISEVATLLGTLKTATEALDSVQGASNFAATSSSTNVAAVASGSATPGTYTFEVLSLAKEQRTYSSGFASATDALGQTGTLSFTVGGAAPVDVDITSDDTVQSIAAKINNSGADVTAAVFFDGTQHRLQIRGNAAGASNAFSIGESGGLALGFSNPGATVQAASDASLSIDGFTVTRGTNSFSDVIPGVNLTLGGVPSGPVQVEVKADADGVFKKVSAAVTAFNAVIDKIHGLAGFGTTKASNPVLAGDSTLRGIASRLRNIAFESVTVDGTTSTLSSLGIGLTRNGKLQLDSDKLRSFLSTDPDRAAKVLGGTTGADGLMDTLRDLVGTMTSSTDGVLAARETALKSRSKSMQDRYDREDARIDKYGERLRAQFTAMDAQVAVNNAQLQFLTGLG